MTSKRAATRSKVVSIDRGTKSPASKGKPQSKERPLSVSQQLVHIALREYRLGCTDDGKVFAVPHNMGNVARPISSGGNGSLMEELAYGLYEHGYNSKGAGKGQVASSAARKDAQVVLAGKARSATPERWHMRVGRGPSGEVVLDMGDVDERAIVVTPKGWKIVGRSPILFRRTAATAAYAEPERVSHRAIDEFRTLLNVSDEHWDLLVSWMIVTFIADIPHALLAILGQEGTAKTDCSRMIVTLVDPSGVPTRATPTSPRDWLVSVQGSWVACLENMSSIPQWLSDLMCIAITGAGDIARGLFTDEELRIIKIMRVLMINGIEVGEMAPDLANRTIRVDLQRISEEDRLTEGEVRAKFDAMQPRLFGALLDLLSKTLAVVERGEHHLDRRPRMADYAEWIHAVDQVRGSQSLDTFNRTNRTMAIGIAEDDPVAVGIRVVLATREVTEWTASAAEWLDALNTFTTSSGRGKQWPRDARAFSARLNRIEAGLETGGWVITRGRGTVKTITIRLPEVPGGEGEDSGTADLSPSQNRVATSQIGVVRRKSVANRRRSRA